MTDPPERAPQLWNPFAGGAEWQLDEIPSELAETEAAQSVTPTSPAPPPPTASTPTRATEQEPPPSTEQLLEAFLFIGGPPLTAAIAGNLIRGLTPESYCATIASLNARYRRQRRPYAIVSSEAGEVLRVTGRWQVLKERLAGGPRETRLSQPAIDTLALAAYRQPISKSELDALRGSDTGNIIRQLLRLGLLTVVKRAEAGAEAAYGTTARFLEVFGLRSLDDLPRTGDVRQL